MDVHLPVALVDAVDRAFADAGLVLDVDAGVRDDVRHRLAPPLGTPELGRGRCPARAAYGRRTYGSRSTAGESPDLGTTAGPRNPQATVLPGRDPDAARGTYRRSA